MLMVMMAAKRSRACAAVLPVVSTDSVRSVLRSPGRAPAKIDSKAAAVFNWRARVDSIISIISFCMRIIAHKRRPFTLVYAHTYDYSSAADFILFSGSAAQLGGFEPGRSADVSSAMFHLIRNAPVCRRV